MEYIILGLLQLKPMTGYEIAKFIEGSLNMICSSSAGSIQTALKKLLSNNHISYKVSVENGKNKKTFSITACGKQQFSNWVQNPMQMEKVKNIELSKLFFLGFAENSKRIESIENYISQLKEAKQTLTVIKDSFDKINTSKLSENCPDADNIHDITLFQGFTLDYGIASIEFDIIWYSDLLKKMTMC